MMSRQLQTSLVALSLLVCCLTASAVKTGPSASSFAAFVSKLHMGKLSGYPEQDYSGYYTEKADVCLSIIEVDNCINNYNTSPALYHFFYTTQLGCCDKDSYGSSNNKVIPAEPVPVVSCDTAGTSYWSNPIYILGSPDETCSTAKVGEATITCTFKDASETCSGALCKGLTITADTTIYGTYGYTHTLPPSPKGDKSCSTADDSSRKTAAVGSSAQTRFGPGFVAKASSDKSDSSSSTPQQRDAKVQGGYKYEQGVHAGWVYIYSGSITSVNGAKDHEWCGGWLELTNQWVKDEVVDCPNNPWIHPQTLKLDLVKTTKAHEEEEKY